MFCIKFPTTQALPELLQESGSSWMNSKFQSFYFIFLLLQMVSLEKHVAAFSSVNTLLYICELLLSGDYLSYIIPDIQSMNV